MMREPEKVDLSALDPTADRLRYERLVRRVVEAAGPELERRSSPSSALALLGGWARPLIAAAAVVGVLAAGVLTATERPGTGGSEASFAETLGVPTPAADWLADGRDPTRADLVLAMERR